MSPGDRSRPGRPFVPGSRARFACAPCRYSKTKCDGTVPCSRCTRRGVNCVPGVNRRRYASQPNPPSTSANSDTPDETDNPVTAEPSSNDRSMNLVHEDGIHREIHCSTVGSAASASSPMHLYYGPSCIFGFIQQLYKIVSAGNSYCNQPNDCNLQEAISALGYDDIFFGVESQTYSSHKLQALAPSDLEALVPIGMATKLLEIYISTVHHIVPFCEPEMLRALMYRVYSKPVPDSKIYMDKTLIIVVLAISATMSDCAPWAEDLYKQAHRRHSAFTNTINMRSVQILMLLSVYQHACGLPTAASVTLANACSKAIAAGLHRDIHASNHSFGYEPAESDQDCMRERRCTFWSLYTYDRHLSLALGRPASIHDIDVDASLTVNRSHLETKVKLSRISNNVYYSVYTQKKDSVAELCSSIKTNMDSLFSFHKSLNASDVFPITKIDIQSTTSAVHAGQMVLAFGIDLVLLFDHLLTKLISVTADFYHIMITNLRPCLLLDMIRKRNIGQGDIVQTAIPQEWIQWIDEKASLCAEFAAQIIGFFTKASCDNPLLGQMRHGRLFVEIACFTLLFNVIRDPLSEKTQDIFDVVCSGMKCFTRLPSDRNLLTSTKAVTRTMELVQAYVSKAKRHYEQTSSNPGDAASRTQEHDRNSCITASVAPNGMNDPYVGPSLDTVFSDQELSMGLFDTGYYLWTDQTSILDSTLWPFDMR